MAYPIVFTNRAAFEAAVGTYTLLKFDTGPDQILNTGSGIEIVYSKLVKFEYDLSGANGPNTGGTIVPHVVMGIPLGLQSTGRVLSPVTAFGFDILSFLPESGTMIVSGVFGPTPPSGYDVRFALAGLTFLGFVSATAFTPVIITGPDSTGTPCRINIDNMAIKTATAAAGAPRPPTGLRVS